MKVFSVKPRLIILILVFISLVLLSCEDELQAVKTEYAVHYSVEGDVASCSIKYTGADGLPVTMEEVNIPWELDIVIPVDMHNRLILSAEAEKTAVFVPYREGTVSTLTTNMLVDSAGGFVGLVKEDDYVFLKDLEYPYANIVEIVSETELELNRDLFNISSKEYRIFREKSLTVSITIDGAEAETNTVSDLFFLSVFVLYPFHME